MHAIKSIMRKFKDSLKLKDNMIVKTRTYYSIQHIQSAALFARLSANIETTLKKEWDKLSAEHRDELLTEYRAYVNRLHLCCRFIS